MNYIGSCVVSRDDADDGSFVMNIIGSCVVSSSGMDLWQRCLYTTCEV